MQLLKWGQEPVRLKWFTMQVRAVVASQVERSEEWWRALPAARLYLAEQLTSQLLTSLQRRLGGTLQHHCRGGLVLQPGVGALQPRPFCPHLPRPLQWCGWDFSLSRPALHPGPALFLLLPHPLLAHPLLHPLLRPLLH